MFVSFSVKYTLVRLSLKQGQKREEHILNRSWLPFMPVDKILLMNYKQILYLFLWRKKKGWKMEAGPVRSKLLS